MKEKRFFIGLVGAVLILALAMPVFAEGSKERGAAAEWPTRPITVMLGWSAGGTSDTTARAVAQEMSEYLGVEIKITNMEGANGGIAYQNVYQAESDGYRWFGGAQVQATYPITKQARVGWEEFYPFPAGMGATTIYVRTDSGYDDVTDLVDAIKSGNKVVKYGTTSRGGNGSIFGEVFAQSAGISDKVQEVPYNGGREAGRYLLSGDVEYISVSLGDVSDWAEEGRIKPVLNLYDKDYVWRGVTFPTVNKYYPELEVYMSINPYWGIAVKRDTPEAVIEKMAEAFVYAVKQDRFKSALESRGIIVNPKMGDAADEAAAIVGAGRGWAQYDYGIVDVSPATLGIPRVTEWKWPYNETSANIRPWPAKAEELYKTEIAD